MQNSANKNILPPPLVCLLILSACPADDVTGNDEVGTESDTMDSADTTGIDSSTTNSTDTTTDGSTESSDVTDSSDSETGGPFCGDGNVDQDEECDDGNTVDTDECTNDCTFAFCGDGILQEGAEECDDSNNVNTDECTNDCTFAFCGDGILQEGAEECDDGNVAQSDGCGTTCMLECGDGVVQPYEDCDFGDMEMSPACTSECEWKCANPVPLVGIMNVQIEGAPCGSGMNGVMCTTDGNPYEGARITFDFLNQMQYFGGNILFYVSFEDLSPMDFDPGWFGPNLNCEPEPLQVGIYHCWLDYNNYPLVGMGEGIIWFQAINICGATDYPEVLITWEPNPG